MLVFDSYFPPPPIITISKLHIDTVHTVVFIFITGSPSGADRTDMVSIKW